MVDPHGTAGGGEGGGGSAGCEAEDEQALLIARPTAGIETRPGSKRE